MNLILQADNRKNSAILVAEGEAEAILMVQKANADSLVLLNQANATEKVITLQVADGRATKIIIPIGIQLLARLAVSVKNLLQTPELSSLKA